ncbi:hypothetical protein ACRS3X_17950 [Ectopseudomonas hydrolytica]|uniref:hypothetical protein n=1 Tax=Ectopseudomonas hydrolytica TaxID=2493633 RepID=UPI003EE41982
MSTDIEKPETGSKIISSGNEKAKKASTTAANKTKPLPKTSSAKKSTPVRKKSAAAKTGQAAKFPRHALNKVLRIPKAILDQNAGQSCSEREAAKFAGVGFGGPFQVEVSSALKYGLLKRLAPGQVAVTDLARKIIRPQQTDDEITGLREAVLQAPDFGEVYQHYRGENLPDPQFFRNALVDKFKIPEDKASEFESIFLETIRDANLLDDHSGKRRILDVAHDASTDTSEQRIKKLGRQVSLKSTDTCFVMMPFANPIGAYYTAIYEPAIQKAGLTPIRADADIFGTGKIIDQIWQGRKRGQIYFSVPLLYWFRPYGESLSLCSRERESNQRESAPGIRVSLRETPLAPALFRGSSRWAIPGPSFLVWHPCQTPLSTAPPLGLLTGFGDRVT